MWPEPFRRHILRLSASTTCRKGSSRRRQPRWRELRIEPLEDRRLLALAPDALGDLAVSSLVSNATADALQLVNAPQGLIELSGGQMALLATGPAPAELRIRAPGNVDAADTTNTDQLQAGDPSGLNLTGEGYTVGVWDGGLIRSTHQEFGSRVTVVDSGDVEDHATHVAGTIGAAGVNAVAKGMATQVSLRSRDWTNDFAEMDADAALIAVSNHSYGYVAGWAIYPASSFGFSTPSGLVDVWWEDRFLYADEAVDFGRYDANARDLDQVLVSHPDLLSVWSAGNDRNDAFSSISGNNTYVAWFSGDPGAIGWSGEGWYLVPNSGATSAPGSDGNAGTGYDSISLTQNAKNALVVGAVNDITADPYATSQIVTTSFSSYGPTDDGRIKPDVVGNGAGLFSSMAASDAAYGSMSGTSMSSPNVAGTAVLLIEHFENESDTTPHSASTKGVLIHTAADGGNLGPDYANGWGLVDAAAAADFITRAAAGAEGYYFEEGAYEGSEWTLEAASDGTQPLKVTIAWTDPTPATLPPYGLDDPTPVLVHDLDLWITGPDGTHFPWTLDRLNPSAPAVRTGANHVDNVEQVLIDAPEAGVYTIHVGATGDSFTQPYSLMMSGAVADLPPAVTLSVTDIPLAEDGGVATVTATLSAASDQEVTVKLAFSGTATWSDDYARSGTSIVIPPHSLTGSIALTAAQDTLDEADETIIIDIDTVTNGREIGHRRVTATITDDDPATSVSLMLTGSPMAEAGGVATVVAWLSTESGLPVLVDLAFSGTATQTTDYSPSATTIMIPPGSTMGSITLTAVQDTVDEPDETILVDVAAIINGIQSETQSFTATITDDDSAPTVTLSLTGSPMSENGGVAEVTATLSNASAFPVTVALGLSGTATMTDDYVPSGTAISIPANSTSGSITLTAVPDWLDEPSETIVVDIESVTNGTENGTQVVTATITNVDLVRFWVVDNLVDDAFGYAADGDNLNRTALVAGATDPRGIAVNADATKFWILNYDKVIYVQDANGGSLGSWSSTQLKQPTGIAVSGSNVWIVDKGTDTVYRFDGAADVTSGQLTASSSFKLDVGNATPEGLATDGATVWVVDGDKLDAVYLYDTSGASLGSWSIDPTNTSPTGIAIDPAGDSQSIWIVDISKARVYEYADARGRTSGSQSAASSFALISTNASPHDIAVRGLNASLQLKSIGAQSIAAESELSFALNAADYGLPAGTLTYAASGLPPGAAFDPATQTFCWTPVMSQAPGTYVVTFSVSDGVSSASEQVAISVFDPYPWQNHVNPPDADGSGRVSPLDALLIINRINLFGSGLLPSRQPDDPYFDVNRDGRVGPDDTLTVINCLNAERKAEGESALPEAGGESRMPAFVPCNVAAAMFPPTETVSDGWQGVETAVTEPRHSEAGLAGATDEPVRASDRTREELLTVLTAARSRADWQAAADDLFAEPDWLLDLEGRRV